MHTYKLTVISCIYKQMYMKRIKHCELCICVISRTFCDECSPSSWKDNTKNVYKHYVTKS
jgi:hypothetical protein